MADILRALRPGEIARAAVTVGVFVVGIAVGVLAHDRVTSAFDYGRLPPKAEAAEPPPADRLTDLLRDGQDAILAEEYDGELLEQLSGALVIGQSQGLVTITDIRHLGTIAEGDESVASYLAFGQLSNGSDGVIAFAVRVRGDEVVGVN